MSSRERWTVYPLLFLTLGIAVKDKLTRTVMTDQVICRSLYVSPQPNLVDVVPAPGKAICGGLVVTDSSTDPQLALSLTPQGGAITTMNRKPADILLGRVLLLDINGNFAPGISVQSSRPRRPATPPDAQPEDKPAEEPEAADSEAESSDVD